MIRSFLVALTLQFIWLLFGYCHAIAQPFSAPESVATHDMSFELAAYISTTVFVTAILIWGRLEWHASFLVGLIAPIVGIIMGMCFPIHLHILVRLPMPRSWLEPISDFIIQTWTIAAAFFLARSLRSRQYRKVNPSNSCDLK
jgi:hypothetical protein